MGQGHTAPVPSGARVQFADCSRQFWFGVNISEEFYCSHRWPLLLKLKICPWILTLITMEVSVLCSAREHTLPPTFSEAQCLSCNPSSVCLLQVWMEIVQLFLRLHLSLTVSPSDLFHHEVSATVRSLTSSLGRDQERHEAWCSRMCVSRPRSLDFRGPCSQSPQTQTVYASTEVLSLWQSAAPALILPWWQWEGSR